MIDRAIRREQCEEDLEQAEPVYKRYRTLSVHVAVRTELTQKILDAFEKDYQQRLGDNKNGGKTKFDQWKWVPL